MSTPVEAMLFHIAEPEAWSPELLFYTPATFEREGFVHLSTRKQVLGTAQKYYAGRENLLMLAIDPDVLLSPVVYENLLGGEELFPHYYAAIPQAAICSVAPMTLQCDGSFLCDLLSLK
ncbi:MAG: DUF952 domain-containing protein [Granulosicoccaceae bacterium]